MNTLKTKTKNRQITLFFASIFLILACSLSGLAAETSQFKFFKLVQIPGIHDQQLLYIDLDREIYKYCQSDFSDVRLFDSKKNEIPRFVHQSFTSEMEVLDKYTELEISELKENPDDQLEIIVTMPETLDLINGINISTSNRDFEKTVSIEARSGESGEWTFLVKDEPIYDFSRFAGVKKHDVRFEEGVYTELRIKIDNVTEEKVSQLKKVSQEFLTDGQSGSVEEEILVRAEPLHIDALKAIHQTEQKRKKDAVEKVYSIRSFESHEDLDKNQTIIDIQTNKEPLTKIHILTESRNFKRNAIVKIDRNGEWKKIGQGSIFNLSYQNIAEEILTISFPETRAQTYRVVIENNDNEPLIVSGIEGSGNVYQMLYLANKGNAYQLFWGNDDLESPEYDTAAITSLVDKGVSIKRARIGRGFTNPDLNTEVKGNSVDFLNSKWFFGVVVILMILILGSALVRAAKKHED